MSDIIRQESRSENQLEQDGFKEYPRKKEIIMARELPASEAPLEITASQGETLIAQAGYMICYQLQENFMENPDNYDRWPVESHIFEKTYKAWDEALPASQIIKQLTAIGCNAYYKSAGVRAKLLETDVYIQSLEHEKPVLVPKDRVLAIGAEGEPYHMGNETFHDRYDARLMKKPGNLKKLVNRLVKFFKQD